MANHDARPPLDRETIRRLLEAGVMLHVPGPEGWTGLAPEAILDWYADPEAYWAQQAGVSVEDWCAYEAAHGSLPCPATTLQGRPCQGLVGHANTVQEWVRRRGERCYIHQERDTARSRR